MLTRYFSPISDIDNFFIKETEMTKFLNLLEYSIDDKKYISNLNTFNITNNLVKLDIQNDVIFKKSNKKRIRLFQLESNEWIHLYSENSGLIAFRDCITDNFGNLLVTLQFYGNNKYILFVHNDVLTQEIKYAKLRTECINLLSNNTILNFYLITFSSNIKVRKLLKFKPVFNIKNHLIKKFNLI